MHRSYGPTSRTHSGHNHAFQVDDQPGPARNLQDFGNQVFLKLFPGEFRRHGAATEGVPGEEIPFRPGHG